MVNPGYRLTELESASGANTNSDGTVILRGPVHFRVERDAALRPAYSVPGVTKVENHTFFVQR